MSYEAGNPHSVERAEQMLLRWICGVSLEDRKRREDLNSLLGI